MYHLKCENDNKIHFLKVRDTCTLVRYQITAVQKGNINPF